MKTAIRRVPPVLTVLSLALVLLALSATGATAASVGYAQETYAAYEAQLNTGQIREATINKRLRSIRILLTNGRLVKAQYQPHEEPKVLKELKAHKVKVTVLTVEQAKKEQGKRPVKHKLRYIAGGIVVAVIVIVGGVVFYNRRRREASEVG